MQWLIPIASSITWSTKGKGSTIARSGIVIAYVPAEASVRAVVGDCVVNRNVKDVSRYNRYAVEVKALNSAGKEYEDGRSEILTPVKEDLEKCWEVRS
jgi:hypothetical protein